MAAAGLAVRGSGICWRVRAADANDDLHDPGGRLLRAILVSARSLAPRTPAFWSDIARLARRGAIPRAGKRAACLGIAVGYGLFWLGARPAPVPALAVAAMMLACALWKIGRAHV